MRVTAVRARYDHIGHSWRRATAQCRVALIGELGLLSLRLPVESPHGQDPDDIAALGADIEQLITAIRIGLSAAD